jgi:hypothetical protein
MAAAWALRCAISGALTINATMTVRTWRTYGNYTSRCVPATAIDRCVDVNLL